MYTMYLNILMVLYFTTVLASTPLSLTHYSAQCDNARSAWHTLSSWAESKDVPYLLYTSFILYISITFFTLRLRSVWQCPLSVTVQCHPERSRRMFRIYFTLRLRLSCHAERSRSVVLIWKVDVEGWFFILPPCWLRLRSAWHTIPLSVTMPAQCDCTMSSWAESKGVPYLLYTSFILYISTTFFTLRLRSVWQ